MPDDIPTDLTQFTPTCLGDAWSKLIQSAFCMCEILECIRQTNWTEQSWPAPIKLTSYTVAEWLACWTQAQKGLGSNRSRDAVLGKLFTPIVPLFTKQQKW